MFLAAAVAEGVVPTAMLEALEERAQEAKLGFGRIR